MILQQNLFHEWSVTNIFGSKKDKQGKMIVTYCDSYKDALEKIAAIKKVRKARKYVLKKAKKVLAGIESGDHSFSQTSGASSGRSNAKPEAVQLGLFRGPESAILDMLNRIDITQMTPVEALNYLDRLCELAKE